MTIQNSNVIHWLQCNLLGLPRCKFYSAILPFTHTVLFFLALSSYLIISDFIRKNTAIAHKLFLSMRLHFIHNFVMVGSIS